MLIMPLKVYIYWAFVFRFYKIKRAEGCKNDGYVLYFQ